jgi:hypothetical protein
MARDHHARSGAPGAAAVQSGGGHPVVAFVAPSIQALEQVAGADWPCLRDLARAGVIDMWESVNGGSPYVITPRRRR